MCVIANVESVCVLLCIVEGVFKHIHLAKPSQKVNLILPPSLTLSSSLLSYTGPVQVCSHSNNGVSQQFFKLPELQVDTHSVMCVSPMNNDF